jgi:hypothetical protein
VEVLIGLLPGGKVGDAERDGVTHLGSLLVVYRAKLSEVDGKKVVCPVNLTQVGSAVIHTISSVIDRPKALGFQSRGIYSRGRCWQGRQVA